MTGSPADRRPPTRLRRVLPAITGTSVAVAGGAFLAGGAAGWGLTGWMGLSLTGPVRETSTDYWAILGRNAAVVACLAIGVLTIGVLTLGILAFNGIVVGVAAHLLVDAGLGGRLWTGLAPHFVPEVAAFVLAAAADLWLCGTVARWLTTGVRPALGPRARDWTTVQMLALLLLAAAALVETRVSTGA